ncbi:VOC family protein [Sabulicella glaciei]|uniref:VOC family protein n=1 Tax=Sabulicella glaciei TaxID=2984948 RepID=A0ABT3NYU6_9PROT|nr:VOC family protein [Roseococcus sp. MDT2-1-1]MCW8087298.1 VOC family protein [Roseococcus sp. MDT2-1-1]
MAEIDHIVLGARTLEEGAAFIERELGVKCQAGGIHEGAGTHNMLLGLGPDSYLEVIAPDPKQPQPVHPRLFDLDEPAVRLMLETGPALVGWVARTGAMDALVARLGPRGGELREMRRGDLHWRMAIPPQRQDMDNLVPALIEWRGERAGKRLRDSHCRLLGLEAEHPEADQVLAALADRGLEGAMRVRRGPRPRLIARLKTPDGGEKVLTSA